MTVVLCGVAADSTNINPVPKVDSERRFEYIPIPEKGESTETRTYGTLDQEYGSGSLAELIKKYKTRKGNPWVNDPQSIRDQIVHYDPNLEQLTYGEHRPGYVSELRDLNPGDIVAFYAGFHTQSASLTHRYIIGYFTVASDPVKINPGLNTEEKRDLLEDHPNNAHTKRFKAHGDLYYHDPEFISSTRPVIIVPGKEPGGRLERAIRISDDELRNGQFYMSDEICEILDPQQGGKAGINLGGFKQSVRCNLSVPDFIEFIESRSCDP